MPGLVVDDPLSLALQSLGLQRPTPPVEPSLDLLLEAHWCLIAKAAIAQDDQPAMRRALEVLTPAAGQLAAGSGLVNLGPIDQYLEDLAAHVQNPETTPT
jgi:hypothetical protein